MTALVATDAAAPEAAVLPLLRRVALRYLPLLFLCYVVSIIDRVNVGFAKTQMQQALQFSDVVYGLGAGIFFVGYFIFEVPSNMLLARVGARRWIARILMMWGRRQQGSLSSRRRRSSTCCASCSVCSRPASFLASCC